MKKSLISKIVLASLIAVNGCISPNYNIKESEIKKFEEICIKENTIIDEQEGKEWIRNTCYFFVGDGWDRILTRVKKMNEENKFPCQKGYECGKWEVPSEDDWKKSFERIPKEFFGGVSYPERRVFWSSTEHPISEVYNKGYSPYAEKFTYLNKKKNIGFLIPVRKCKKR